MRQGFDGLAAQVCAAGLDLFSGHLFVFVSRRGDRVKILTWDTGGLVLWAKRLEIGRFRCPTIAPGVGQVGLDADQLTLILAGFDLNSVRRPKRWEPTKKDRQAEATVI
jgi:transposase